MVLINSLKYLVSGLFYSRLISEGSHVRVAGLASCPWAPAMYRLLDLVLLRTGLPAVYVV